MRLRDRESGNWFLGPSGVLRLLLLAGAGLGLDRHRLAGARALARQHVLRRELGLAGALVDALANGVIAAAGIDVLSTEPPVNGDPLLDYRGDNLIVTPHIAWATAEARQNAIDELAANVAAYLAGEKRNRVD